MRQKRWRERTKSGKNQSKSKRRKLCFAISVNKRQAVAILLTLLYLGVKNIKLGPSLPAFISPGVLNILVEKFNISPIGDVDEDLALMLK
jgi:hydroxylamine reductase